MLAGNILLKSTIETQGKGVKFLSAMANLSIMFKVNNKEKRMT